MCGRQAARAVLLKAEKDLSFLTLDNAARRMHTAPLMTESAHMSLSRLVVVTLSILPL